MGEVYRARDTKLNRDVALKVLPDLFVTDSDRLARFKREAQLLASLNHSNIATIYGFEETDGVRALVLELVEGPTLADRIAEGPIPLDEALPIAKQIAEALEAAHDQGIVHRDLKPANIKLRPGGTVKVLDFGLAKALDPNPGAKDMSDAPTVTSPGMTQMGVILGTAAYMSPEQARGKPVDKRADIWAFGCVLYEMLTGGGPFAGETVSDMIAKALEREPDWHALPASTPTRLRELLRQCLQKDQHHRLHDIGDARIEIEEAQAGRTGSQPVVRTIAAAGGVAVALALVGGAWWYGARSIPPVRHDPVSVIIADFQNHTNDPVFDRTLEPLVRIVLEGANFVSAYDRTRVSGSLGVRPPDTLDEHAAREIAATQGLGVVLSGSLETSGTGYKIAVRAVQAVTGDVISSAQGTVSNKDQVLSEVTTLVAAIRKGLGDDTSDSAQRFAMETLSSTSLEVLHHYSAAMEALSNSQFDAAQRSFSKAVDLDPNFGLAYAGMAMMARNLGRQQDAEKYAKEAVRYVDVDGMTERERYRIRGLFYVISGDYQACMKEYGDLIARYADDVAARNNLALCSTYLRNMPTAIDEMRRVIAIMPKRALYRVNLALYAAYGGDFQTAEREARTAQGLGSPLGLLPLAFAQLGQDQISRAAESYQTLGKANSLGASFSASGLGDLAVYEGRFSDAAQILKQGAAADLTSKNSDRAAAKLAALAYTQLLRGQMRAASEAAENALANSQAVKIRFLVARVFVEAGEIGRARTLAAGLASGFQAEPRAYAKIVESGVALKNGDPRKAIDVLIEATGLLDTWIGHFDLGRAYLEAGLFTQADSEFDRCIKRRGEALSLFLDEEPTYRYFPTVHYYQGRTREGLNSGGFAESYHTYLSIRGNSSEDPLVLQARRRAGL
jgi:serine/threonine protein kinase/tetratricopeptide (TPR) repeat protein